ncbi:MAG: hypothetical protein ACO4CG_08435 [Prochlorothrix sp.]|nr:hypothetical protein [Prochlorothrix sp.]
MKIDPDRPTHRKSWFRRLNAPLQTRSIGLKALRSRPLRLGSIAAGFILLAALLNTWLDHTAEYALTQTLSTTTDLTVQLGDLQLQPLQSRATLTDLILSNPPNFSPQPLLTLDQLSLHLQIPSLWQSPLTLSTLHLHGLTLRIEQRLHRNNLAELIDRLEAWSTRRSASSPQNPSAQKAFQIDHLILSEVTLIVRLNVLGAIGAEQTLVFREIDLADLDQDTFADRLRDTLLAQAQQQLQDFVQDWVPPPAPVPSP